MTISSSKLPSAHTLGRKTILHLSYLHCGHLFAIEIRCWYWSWQNRNSMRYRRDHYDKFSREPFSQYGRTTGSSRWSPVMQSFYCPASRTTLVATRFRVAVICPIIQVPHCIRVFFYFVWFVFINHIFQFYYELCTYCYILDIYLS